MKCPYCNYINGWDHKSMNNIEGEEGSFFHVTNNIIMEREGGDGYHCNKDKRSLVGCPNCDKVFMELD